MYAECETLIHCITLINISVLMTFMLTCFFLFCGILNTDRNIYLTNAYHNSNKGNQQNTK